MVQRFTPLLHHERDRYRDHVIEDIAWCREEGVDYVPIVYAGFSWQNLSKTRPGFVRASAYGAIPRLGGRFYWDLIHSAITAGAEMLYVAMFDEIDEGTAIIPVSDNPPESEDYHFVDNDGMPGDHYLWLTGKAGRVLRREIPNTPDIPQRK
jgi:hypothetical protein